MEAERVEAERVEAEREQAEREDAEREEAEREEEEEDVRPSGRRAMLAGLFDALPTSPRFWNLFAGGCVVVAALAVLTGHTDTAFVVATLGILAWFIEKRNHLQGKMTDEKSTDERLKEQVGKR